MKGKVGGQWNKIFMKIFRSKERGSPFLINCKKATGMISACARGLGRVSRQTPFQPVRVIKITIKTIWTSKRAFVTSF